MMIRAIYLTAEVERWIVYVARYRHVYDTQPARSRPDLCISQGPIVSVATVCSSFVLTTLFGIKIQEANICLYHLAWSQQSL